MKYGRITDQMITGKIEYFLKLYHRVTGRNLTIRYENTYDRWYSMQMIETARNVTGTRHDIYAHLVGMCESLEMQER